MGQAVALAYLGGFHAGTGDARRARQQWIKARDLFETLGLRDKAQEMIALLHALPTVHAAGEATGDARSDE